MRILPTAFLLALIGLTPPPNAGALVMCAKVRISTGEIREGTPIRLRAECKTHEIEIDPVALDLQGPPGEQGPQGEPGVPGEPGSTLAVKNANGATIATVLDGGLVSEGPDGASLLTVRAVFEHEGALPFLLELDPQLGPLDNLFGRAVFFSGSDCSGTPYVYAPTGVLAGAVVWGIAYVPQSSIPQRVTSFSRLNSSQGCVNGLLFEDLVPALALDAAALGIETPLTVENR